MNGLLRFDASSRLLDYWVGSSRRTEGGCCLWQQPFKFWCAIHTFDTRITLRCIGLGASRLDGNTVEEPDPPCAPMHFGTREGVASDPAAGAP
jgi:hypothetical protein